jgi:hypothetical protein
VLNETRLRTENDEIRATERFYSFFGQEEVKEVLGNRKKTDDDGKINNLTLT